ncbi:hypothetical protein AB0F72_09375 [Actinoplanes sp. NPDC023936]
MTDLWTPDDEHRDAEIAQLEAAFALDSPDDERPAFDGHDDDYDREAS